jgi:hypothetical protein
MDDRTKRALAVARLVAERFGPSEGQSKIRCRECGGWFVALGSHINRKHRINEEEYRKRHGRDAPLMAPGLYRSWVSVTLETTDERREAARWLDCAQCGKWRGAREKGRQRVCLECGGGFEVSTARRRYCSDPCREAGWAKRKHPGRKGP